MLDFEDRRTPRLERRAPGQCHIHLASIFDPLPEFYLRVLLMIIISLPHLHQPTH